MKKSLLLAGLALFLLLFVNLLISAPARLLHLILPQDSVLVHGLSGTLWDGGASSVMLRLPQGYFNLGAVQWSLQPGSLLLLAPRVNLRSEWGSQQFAGDLSLRGLRDVDVHELQLQLPASVFGQFAPVSVDGLLSLQIEQLALRDGLPYSAEGRLVWQNSGWQSPRGLVALGTYALDLRQADGEALIGEVVTVDGPLRASGGVQLDGRRYALDVLLSGEQALDAQLQQMLSLMAVPEDGGFRIKLAGNF